MVRRNLRAVVGLCSCAVVAVANGGCTWLQDRIEAVGLLGAEKSAQSDKRGGSNQYRSLSRSKGDGNSRQQAASANGPAATAGEGPSGGQEAVAVVEGLGAPQPDPDGGSSMQGPLNVTRPGQAAGGLTSARAGATSNAQPREIEGVPVVLPPRGAAPKERLSPAQVAARLEQARRLLQRGKVIEARATLHSVSEHQPASALHELGRTYDPYYLGQLPSIDDGSEPRTAATLYQGAISHGAVSAGNDLDRLRASHPGMR